MFGAARRIVCHGMFGVARGLRASCKAGHTPEHTLHIEDALWTMLCDIILAVNFIYDYILPIRAANSRLTVGELTDDSGL